jgi:hypothetical protein
VQHRGDLQPAGPADLAVQVAQAFPRRRRRRRPRAPSGRDTGRRSTRPAAGRARSSRCAGVATAAPAPAGTPGGTETTAAPRCRPRPSSCRTRSVSGPSPPRRDATPPQILSSRTA